MIYVEIKNLKFLFFQVNTSSLAVWLYFIGSRNGLSLVLNIESYDYMPGPNSEAGVKMYLHTPGKLPLVRELGFSLAPGMHYLADIDQTQVS